MLAIILSCNWTLSAYMKIELRSIVSDQVPFGLPAEASNHTGSAGRQRVASEASITTPSRTQTKNTCSRQRIVKAVGHGKRVSLRSVSPISRDGQRMHTPSHFTLLTHRCSTALCTSLQCYRSAARLGRLLVFCHFTMSII